MKFLMIPYISQLTNSVYMCIHIIRSNQMVCCSLICVPGYFLISSVILSLYCSLLFQSILPLLESDLYEICLACAEGTLHQHLPQFTRDLYTSGVVLASGGYPGGYKKGLPISGIQMFHRFYVIV